MSLPSKLQPDEGREGQASLAATVNERTLTGTQACFDSETAAAPKQKQISWSDYLPVKFQICWRQEERRGEQTICSKGWSSGSTLCSGSANLAGLNLPV